MSNEKKSVRRILSGRSSQLALAISVTLGLFTVWDKIIVEPSQRVENALSRLSNIVVEIGKINFTTLSASQNVHDPQASYMNMNHMLAANSVKIPLLASARGIIETHKEHVDTAYLIVLGWELFHAQNYELAEEYANEAHDREDNTNADQLQAMRLLANVKMVNAAYNQSEEGLKKAREQFVNAIEKGKTNPLNGPLVISQILIEWATKEAYLGNCEESADVFKRFFSDIEDILGGKDPAHHAAMGNFLGNLDPSGPCTEEYERAYREMDLPVMNPNGPRG